ncbi:MAG: Type 1 glutamine amidotransferase-like domain-containing protein [Parcubacteria group bacterium]|nr:Type 1 glutamine amidotransferase-like domain-containing protein [Parcubacteria group bacterium]
MKLLLTSVGWWKNPIIGKEFLKLVNKKPSEIRIFLAITPIKYLKRNKYILRQFSLFDEIRIPPENITFFQLDREVKKDDLKSIDVIFVFGGNTFDYLRRIRKTGFDKAIKAFVKSGGVYLGLSAGSYVACPTIEAASWKHADRNEIGLRNFKGLNLVPFLVTAHFEEKLRSIIKKAAQSTKYEVIAITDKQAVLVNGNRRTIIGSGKKNIFNSPNMKIIKINLNPVRNY